MADEVVREYHSTEYNRIVNIIRQKIKTTLEGLYKIHFDTLSARVVELLRQDGFEVTNNDDCPGDRYWTISWAIK